VRNFISEDQIEKEIIKVFGDELGYHHINCFTQDPNNINDRSLRQSKSDVVMKSVLERKLRELNPGLPEKAILDAMNEILKERFAMSPILANKEIYQLIKDGVQVTYQNKQGKDVKVRVKIINFNEPQINEFTVVSQLWIKGTWGVRRPDLILYVNGLPLIFIELKNSNVSLRNAYDDNLTNYKKDIPQLFYFNQVCILSNGLETKIGSFNASWEHFSEWLRVDDEKEKVNKKKIKADKVSLKYTVKGLCEKRNLLDYIESFILYHNDVVKVVAKNHQFLGVNNAIQSFSNRKEKKGKLGVFWHTQGSGKSFSMVYFAKKILRKFTGNFTFLVVTDREDLDEQIYRNFASVEAVGKNDYAQPKNGKELREFLQTNRRFIFTLIQKFRYNKGKQYPLLSDRSDIVVIIDEAHRTQYKDLAENMRKGLPNAQYIAFTGTPLLGKEKKTSAWFGDYVSEYNFAQSIEDGATVPLYYDKRVPEVLMQNQHLSDEFLEIIEDEDLTEEQQQRLEREFAQELEVIKRDDRLDTIAKDIVNHFPIRGYKGKGMVITVDKYTAVKMFDKVQHFWKKEIRRLRKQLNEVLDSDKEQQLKETLDYMRQVEMAVVISEEAGEEEKFMEQGLDIKPHRKRINKLDENGQDIKANFKDTNHPLQLVFVCAMWLTGFDAPTVSTLYLDKPMKNHTLMQTIARANRIAPGKVHGLIVDYYNVFRNIKKALAEYAEGEESKDKNQDEGRSLVQEKAKLYLLLDEAVHEGVSFCKSLGIDLGLIAKSKQIFEKLEYFEEFADIILQKDDWKKQFRVYDNTIQALYEACKPEIIYDKTQRPGISIFHYLRDIIDRKMDRGNLDKAKKRISELLDESVTTQNWGHLAEGSPEYGIQQYKTVDLSKLDFEKLRETFSKTKYKHIEIADLRTHIEKKLKQLLERNVNRVHFAQKYQEIVDRYNAGGTLTETFFDDLMKFVDDLQEEEKRHVREGLTEEELEIFDLLQKEKLTKKEHQEVKLAARILLQRLTEVKSKILVQDWSKDTQTRIKVEGFIQDILDETLPKSYDRKVYNEKCKLVFNHFYMQAETGRDWTVA
jgi:type I restriction enzyme R subunit